MHILQPEIRGWCQKILHKDSSPAIKAEVKIDIVLLSTGSRIVPSGSMTSISMFSQFTIPKKVDPPEFFVPPPASTSGRNWPLGPDSRR